MEYSISRAFDAMNGETVEADSVEEALELSYNSDGAMISACHQCSREFDLGDCVGTLIRDEDGNEVYNDSHSNVLRKEIAELKEEIKTLTEEAKKC